MSISIFSINARGIRNQLKRKSLFLYCQSKGADFYFIQESHACEADVTFWRSQWGSEVWFSFGSNKSAGVVILKGKFKGHIHSKHTDTEGRWIILHVSIDFSQFIIVNVYATNNKQKNNNLFLTIEGKIEQLCSKFPCAVIIWGGDFNTVMDEEIDRWPPKRKEKTCVLKNICTRLDLLDIWRYTYPQQRMYTWANNDSTKQSRIDFWLISANSANDVKLVGIEVSVLTDHKAIVININKDAASLTGPKTNYWKLNKSLLKNELFKNNVAKIIEKYWKRACALNEFGHNWELMKFEIRSTAIVIGKTIAKVNKEKEYKLIEEIMKLCSKQNLMNEELKQLAYLQSQLDNIYEEKARGAFIRSRQKWLEHGEKNTKYFFNLEKRNNELSSVRKLMINNKICENNKEIAKYVTQFYTNLYTPEPYDDRKTDLFLNKIADTTTKKINDDFKLFCDKDISCEEIKNCIVGLKDNKSPGNDGLTSEFYKMFNVQLTPFLAAMFKESVACEELPVTLRQGLITLIPKPNKDKLYIDNWRPITLLNNDAKLLALVFARRLKKGLNEIIDEEQSGFMTGRHISNNIRLILDMIDYNCYIPTDSYILFIDFYKAFDTVGHEFMFRCIKYFGFGEYFQKAVRTIYNGCNSSVKLSVGTSGRFEINRGIQQGSPLSPFLFLLVTQIMALHIKKAEFEGINIFGRIFKLSQLADDTTIFLKNDLEISKAINCITEFSSVSGLKMNVNKSVLFPIKTCSLTELHGIPVKHIVTYLGVIINKDKNERSVLNFQPIINKTKTRFNIWLQRDLSLNGRVLLSKAEGISRSVYVSLALDMPSKVYKELDKLLFNFLWRNKHHYLRKEIICKQKSQGGLSVLSFETLNNTFKVNWLIKFMKEKDSIWYTIPKHVFDMMGGIDLLLRCDFKIDKLPVKLANFHKQALLAWMLVYKHNFSPNKYIIWNNRCIKYKNESLFYKNWYENDIVFVKQLLNSNGNLLAYNEFLEKFGFPVTPKEYAIVFDAIPHPVIQFVRSCGSNSFEAMYVKESFFLGGIDILKQSYTNKFLRNIITGDTITHKCVKWNSVFGEIDWNKAWRVCDMFWLNNKVKEVTFKILHGIYPAKSVLERFNLEIDYSCDFCSGEKESIIHLFCNCAFTRIFWVDMENFIRRKTNIIFMLNNFDICMYYSNEINNNNFILLVQLLIILGKFHIHKKKWSGSKPNFSHFLQEIKDYCTSLENIINKKAIKTYGLFQKFKIF